MILLLDRVLPAPDLRPFVVVCGWCPDKDAKTRAAEKTGAQVSHGLCPACALILEALATEVA